MPPSDPPDKSPRAEYQAFIDAFFQTDAADIKVRLDDVVRVRALDARVSQDAISQALCGGIHEWRKQRLLTNIISGTASHTPDHPITKVEGFHPNWLLNRSLVDTMHVHRQAIKHLVVLEDWAKEFSDDEQAAALAAMRDDIESLIQGIEEWKSVAGRPPGRNWSAHCAHAMGARDGDDGTGRPRRRGRA